MYLMRAEVPGPSVGKLVAKAKDTALILYSIYFALMVLMAVMLLFGGMNVYEAFTTALSTAGTGGFMVYDAGFIGLSPYLQTVTTVFMISLILWSCHRFGSSKVCPSASLNSCFEQTMFPV